MSTHSKAVEEKTTKAYYLSVRLIKKIAKIAGEQERSESYIVDRLLDKATANRKGAAA